MVTLRSKAFEFTFRFAIEIEYLQRPLLKLKLYSYDGYFLQENTKKVGGVFYFLERLRPPASGTENSGDVRLLENRA